MREQITQLGRELALEGLKSGAIKISPDKPFLWASGTYNPIYNDNRMFLGDHHLRRKIVEALQLLTFSKAKSVEVIAGTSTAGIPHATLLADKLFLPLIYIRDKPKDHGMMNQIEGIDAAKSLGGRRVLLIEDLISTGGSSVKAVDAIRKANGSILNCFSIFNYGLPQARKMFAGEIPFGSGPEDCLEYPCEVDSILDYPTLLEIGINKGFIKKEDEKMLKSWKDDQENWGDLHGFPRVKK